MSGFYGIRDSIKAISPPWLADGIAEKYLYVIGLSLEGEQELATQGVKARLPGYGDPSALSLIGADRNIDRGEGEPDASYAARLSRAFPTWRSAGSAGAVIKQIFAFLQVETIVRTVNNSGGWDNSDGIPDATGDIPIVHYQAVPGNWNWDGLTDRWWRAWVIIYANSGVPWSNEGTWGDGAVWGDGGTWGSSATPEEVKSIQLLVKKWKPAHCIVPWIIVVLDDPTLFDPLGSGVPNGTWGTWSVDVSGTQVPTRAPTAVYWDGIERGF